MYNLYIEKRSVHFFRGRPRIDVVSFFLPKHGAPARHCSNVMGYVDGGAECSEEDDEEEDELCPHPLLALRVALCAHCTLMCSSPEVLILLIF